MDEIEVDDITISFQQLRSACDLIAITLNKAEGIEIDPDEVAFSLWVMFGGEALITIGEEE